MARPARERVEGEEEEKRRVVSWISLRDSRRRRWSWVVANVVGESLVGGMVVGGNMVVEFAVDLRGWNVMVLHRLCPIAVEDKIRRPVLEMLRGWLMQKYVSLI